MVFEKPLGQSHKSFKGQPKWGTPLACLLRGPFVGSKSFPSVPSALGAKDRSCLPELVNRPEVLWRGGSPPQKVEGALRVR